LEGIRIIGLLDVSRVLPLPSSKNIRLDVPIHTTPGESHRTQNLNTQHGIYTPLCNPLPSQNLAVFNTTRLKLVLILEIMFLELCGNVLSKVGVGVNGIYEVYEGWIVAVGLVAWSGAEFENFALSGVDKGGDNGGVFIGDESVGWA
jgi:hypothetical protein